MVPYGRLDYIKGTIDAFTESAPASASAATLLKKHMSTKHLTRTISILQQGCLLFPKGRSAYLNLESKVGDSSIQDNAKNAVFHSTYSIFRSPLIINV